MATEERNTASFKKFTVYITEIRIEGIEIKSFLRFSQVAELE